MIGVIARDGQDGVVEEFFQLFKTPWEFYRPGRAYRVILATTDEIPEIQPELLLVYGPAAKSIDARMGIAPEGRHPRTIPNGGDSLLPIYGELITFPESGAGTPCLTVESGIAGIRVCLPDSVMVRLGYDLFDEVRFLLSTGQPVEQAHIPTLDIHIQMLRDWILDAGIPLIEIPPVPAGHRFAICLTHDIDFVGIRYHRFDHSMWGFCYRATAGALRNFARGRLSLACLVRSWLAAVSLPFVYAGWAKDFWEPFEWYLGAEKGLPSTYYLIPFKRRAGDRVPGRHASRRATAYDIGDVRQAAETLMNQGCELGVHGIDGWHSASKGRDELDAVAAVSGESGMGIRMHWLLRDSTTPLALEQAGYAYDSTAGYNETIGYRAGTHQVFRPLGAQKLLEVPLHIQDGALFYRQRLDLSEPEAEKRCHALIGNARNFGGVLTLLWHDRSHGPERFWGDFYVRLLGTLRSSGGWFGTASQVAGWFQKRREARFERVEAAGGVRARLRYEGQDIQPPLTIRTHSPRRPSDREPAGTSRRDFVDVAWNGQSEGQPELELVSRN